MEKISNEDKKKIFMSMVEKDKNGTLDMMRMTDSKKYDEMYSQLVNNHGPFGIVLDGITKEGKISVYLAENLEKQLPSEMGSLNCMNLRLDESELNDFLDRFFEMNNMEILNEFYKNEPEYFKKSSLEEHNDMYYSRLATLNSLDYLSNQGLGNIITRGRDNYSFENGLNVFLDCDNNEIIIDNNKESISLVIKNNQVQEVENSKLTQYAEIVLKSIKELPEVYESITSGNYQKENFRISEEPNFEINEYGEIIRPNNKTPLQQKEEELAALEKEFKTISEAEALIDRQNEGQNIGE